MDNNILLKHPMASKYMDKLYCITIENLITEF